MEEYKSFKRRDFLRASLPLAALAFMPDAWAASAKKEIPLTILHTNDWHSRIDPFPENDPKFPGQGGASRRATLLKQLRKEHPNVLLLDAGDMVQGTAYFNYYHGEPEIKIMNHLGYDAATLGNHDFDNGVAALARLIKKANFPFVNCNYDFESTELAGLVKKSVILKKGGVKIGIVGVGIDLGPLLPAENIIGIHYNDPIEPAEREANRLKNEVKCDMVICLSHLGYEYRDNKVSDRVLASNSRHIDLIIGGHTHTFLEKPVQVANLNSKMVTINQVGWAGLRLGQINYLFSSINNTKNGLTSQIEDFKKSIVI